MSPQLITWKWETANRILKHGMAEKDPLRYQLFFVKLDFFMHNPHGQRNLAGDSPWGCKESDTTEQVSTARHML